jgi:Mn2+/Fe2+ NRAMP family transporter
VGRSLVSWGPLPGGLTSNTLLILVADVGATVTPWMLFFQQSAVVDKGLTPDDIRHGRFDTLLGAVLATAAALATVLAAAPLFAHHISAADFQAAQFAQALQPYIGHVGAALFALGVFEAGMVAAITISTSSAYAFGEVTGQAHSLNRPLREGWLFYAVLVAGAAAAAGLTLIPGAPLEFIVLIVNVIAVLAMPPALLFLLLLVNDREVMGRHVNSRLQNVAAVGIVAMLVIMNGLYGLSVVLPSLLPH